MKNKCWKLAGFFLVVFALVAVGCASSPAETRPTWQIFYEAGELDSAIDYCTQAIETNANEFDAYYYRGRAYSDKGDYDKAIADFTEMIRQYPSDFRALTYRGRAYVYKGDYEKAIADFTDALTSTADFITTVFPADIDVALILGPDYVSYFDRAYAYYLNGDYDYAIEDFTRHIDSRRYSRSSDAYFYRGLIYSDRGDYDRAIADFTEALRLAPDFKAAKDSLEIAKKRGK
jgi:tetratricopeptide (TPR) repeat protein